MAPWLSACLSAPREALLATAVLLLAGCGTQDPTGFIEDKVVIDENDGSVESQVPPDNPRSGGDTENQQAPSNQYNGSVSDNTEGKSTAPKVDDAEKYNGLQYGGTNIMNIIIVFILIVCAIFLLIIWQIGSRRKPKAPPKKREPGMGIDSQSTPRRGLALDGLRDTEISDLRHKVESMERRLQALENSKGARTEGPAVIEPQSKPLPGSGYVFAEEDSYYDRIRERVDLPEDKPAVAQPSQEKGYSAETPRSPQSDAMSLQHLAASLVSLFNSANKPDFDALANRYGAETYTNDRRGDLARLIKDDIDRFWVVPVPGRSEFALMIPGFTVKKSWAKLRQPETDHPLAYHFDLRRGDRLQVMKPAVLRLNTSNVWELYQKGEVVGIS